MRRLRSDVLIRRFLDGATLTELAYDLGRQHGWAQSYALEWIERAIRRAFDRAKKARGKTR